MHKQLKQGQTISFRYDLTPEEIEEFRGTVGLLRGAANTIKLLKGQAVFKYIKGDNTSIAADFPDGNQWWVPIKFVLLEPLDKDKLILDKIKYLDQRFKQRKASHAHV
jgi:hypothetical protein